MTFRSARRRGIRIGLQLLAVATASAVVALGAMIGIRAVRGAALPGGTGAAHAVRPLAVTAGVPAPGTTGTATCVDPGTALQWRVTWQASAGVPGTTIAATGFASRPMTSTDVDTGPGPADADGAGWTSRDGDVWVLRWTPPPDGSSTSILERRGTLAQLSRVGAAAADAPRFVSPDGGCSAFPVLFAAGVPGWRRVAVIGDSLVAQLHSATDDARWRTGLLQRRLLERSVRAEVHGQSGRRWTALPDRPAGPDVADRVLTDEIRGLRGADAHVVALGTNDAGWVSQAPDDEQFRLRLAWVLLNLAPVLDEIRGSGQCTVLVTPSDGNQSYAGAPAGRFAQASRRIGDYLRERAAADPHDGLLLSDWAAAAAGHHAGDRQPWFGPDTIHLDAAGREAYADHLARSASLCP